MPRFFPSVNTPRSPSLPALILSTHEGEYITSYFDYTHQRADDPTPSAILGRCSAPLHSYGYPFLLLHRSSGGFDLPLSDTAGLHAHGRCNFLTG